MRVTEEEEEEEKKEKEKNARKNFASRFKSWAFPVSLAVTKGILVSFFSSAD